MHTPLSLTPTARSKPGPALWIALCLIGNLLACNGKDSNAMPQQTPAATPIAQLSEPSPTSSTGSANNFDYYLLSMSITPTFCALDARRASRKTECEINTLSADFKSVPISIHGLWPNRSHGQHPFFCGVAKSERKDHCSLPRVQGLSSKTAKELSTYMPGSADCLDRWEWNKHGSCSGLNEDQYFSKTIAWAKRLNQSMGPAILKSAGGNINLTQLRQQVAQKDPELAQSLRFSCAMPRSRGGFQPPIPALVEIRVRIDKSGDKAIALDDPRFGQSGCQNQQAYIAAPQDLQQ